MPYFLRKTKMANGRSLVFRRTLLSWSVFAHVAPSRTLYGKCSKALWMFRGDLVACTRGVRGQPFSSNSSLFTVLVCLFAVNAKTTTRVEKERPEECPPRVEIARLSVLGEISWDFRFFLSGRPPFLIISNLHSICVLEWWPNQRNKCICFARTPSMAHRSREARRSKWQNYVMHPRASSVYHPYTPQRHGITNTYVSTVRTHKSPNHTHPHCCCIHTHAYKHLVHTCTVHMLDQKIMYTECLLVCQNRINCVPHRLIIHQ